MRELSVVRSITKAKVSLDVIQPAVFAHHENARHRHYSRAEALRYKVVALTGGACHNAVSLRNVVDVQAPHHR